MVLSASDCLGLYDLGLILPSGNSSLEKTGSAGDSSGGSIGESSGGKAGRASRCNEGFLAPSERPNEARPATCWEEELPFLPPALCEGGSQVFAVALEVVLLKN